MNEKVAQLIIKIKETGSEVFSKISGNLKMIGAAATAAFGVVSAVVVKSIAEYKEAEAASNKLNQAMVQQGIYSAKLREQYDAMADAQAEKSLYDDDEITNAQAIMQGYLGQTKITEGLMKATLDLAAAKKIDLASAADLVGKSVGTSTNALARQGIQLPDNISKTEKLAFVTQQLTNKFGGQAEAATQGLGSLQMMEKSINNLFETIGERLQPVVVMLAQAITSMANEIRNSGPALEGLLFVIEATAKGGTILWNVLAGLGEYIGGAFAAYIMAIGQILEGNFKMAFETISTAAKDLGNQLVARWNKTGDDLKSIDNAFLQARTSHIKQQHELEIANGERKRQIQDQKNRELASAQQASWTEEDQANLTHFLQMQEQRQMASETELADLRAKIEMEKSEKDMARLAELEAMIAFSENKAAILAAQEERNLILKKYYDDQHKKMADKKAADDKARRDKEANEEFANAVKRADLAAIIDSKRVQQAESSMNYLARMQDSKNKELVAIGKAAAIAQITVDTARAAMAVWGWAAAIPFVGPALATALTAAIVVYGAEQISRVNSAQMADGGIVKARPGGMLATIGEGGRDEAVIPLEDGRVPGMGGNITVIVNGGLLGDAASARELAVALDRELLRLRQSNQSVSFEGIA